MLISVLARTFVNFKFLTCIEQWAVGSVVIWTLQYIFVKILTTY